MWGVGYDDDNTIQKRSNDKNNNNNDNNSNKNKNNDKNKKQDAPQYAVDPASVYREDEEFLSALRSADVTMYSYGAPRSGSPAFSKVSYCRGHNSRLNSDFLDSVCLSQLTLFTFLHLLPSLVLIDVRRADP